MGLHAKKESLQLPFRTSFPHSPWSNTPSYCWNYSHHHIPLDPNIPVIMIIGLTSPLLVRNPHIHVVGQRAEIFKKYYHHYRYYIIVTSIYIYLPLAAGVHVPLPTPMKCRVYASWMEGTSNHVPFSQMTPDCLIVCI